MTWKYSTWQSLTGRSTEPPQSLLSHFSLIRDGTSSSPLSLSASVHLNQRSPASSLSGISLTELSLLNFFWGSFFFFFVAICFLFVCYGFIAVTITLYIFLAIKFSMVYEWICWVVFYNI